MFTYGAYDLTIQSELELPELPHAGTSGAPDVLIRRGEVTAVPQTDDGADSRHIEAESGVCRLTYDSIGSFRVEGGKRITFDPNTEDTLQREFFRRLIENELLGLLLHQRDHLVLHASAVAVDGHGAIFLGPRGAGKSTTAAAMHLQGHSMLEDDVVGVRFDSGTPMLVPGVPQLRLRPNAADALGVKAESTPSEESWYEKRFLDVNEIPGAVPLSCCYILRSGDDLTLEPYSGQERMLELISRTHARGLLSDTDQAPVHFELCSTVASQCGFRVLKRPYDHSILPEIVETIAMDLREDDGSEDDSRDSASR